MTLYARTIANGGGTFNRNGEDVTHGCSVSVVNGTWQTVAAGDVEAFNDAIRILYFNLDGFAKPYVNEYGVRVYSSAYVGTWVDGDTIHIDPVLVVDDESTARTLAIANNQLAYYILHENREVRI